MFQSYQYERNKDDSLERVQIVDGGESCSGVGEDYASGQSSRQEFDVVFGEQEHKN